MGRSPYSRSCDLAPLVLIAAGALSCSREPGPSTTGIYGLAPWDLRSDTNEWRNLAGDPERADVLEEHRRWLPGPSARPAPGSRNRILIYEDDVAVWEGEEIGPSDAVPEI